MAVLPNDLALTVINDGSTIIASDHRNNYAAIQAATNALRDALANGSAGQLVYVIDGTHIGLALLTDANVDAAAAIAYSKLALAGHIVNADIAAAAAIALSKVAAGTNHTLLLSGASAVGSLGAGTSGQLLTSAGAAADPAWVTLSAATILTGYSSVFNISNNSTPNTIFTQSIPANFIGANGALDIAIGGDFLYNLGGGPGDFTFTISFGGTTLWQVNTAVSGTGLTSNARHHAVTMRALLANEGAANAQRLAGLLTISGVTAPVTGLGNLQEDASSNGTSGSFGGTSTVDSTGAQTLVIAVQLATADANFAFKGSVHVQWRP